MKIVVCGAGGHAYVVIDILQSCGEHDIVGVLDAGAGVSNILGIPIIGDDAMIHTLTEQGIEGAIVAIGSNKVREKVFGQLVRHGLKLINAIHPSAVISRSVHLGHGIAVMPGAVINVETRIGNNCIINTGATIDHHNNVDDHVHIAPGCHLAGNVRVGSSSFLGIGTTVIDNITIGSNVTVGGGTSIYSDVPANSKVVGAAMRYIDQ